MKDINVMNACVPALSEVVLLRAQPHLEHQCEREGQREKKGIQWYTYSRASAVVVYHLPENICSRAAASQVAFPWATYCYLSRKLRSVPYF